MKILPMEETLGEKSETIKGRPVKEQKKDEKININRATLEELITLPGIGPVLAERIIEYRKQSGGFKRIEEIMKVKGIGRKKFARLKDKIKID